MVLTARPDQVSRAEINSAELVLQVDVARGDVDDGAVSLDWSRGPPHCAPTRATNWSYSVLRAKSTRRRWTSRRSCTPTEPDCGGRGDATDPDARRGPGCKFPDRVQRTPSAARQARDRGQTAHEVGAANARVRDSWCRTGGCRRSAVPGVAGR